MNDEEFRAAMSPLTSALTTFAVSIRDQGEENGQLPAPISQAMAELATEAKWSVPSWKEPVRNAHSYGGMLLYLIAEHLAAYAAIVERAGVGPRFAHMPVVRAALEAVPIAHWLWDTSIGPEQRVRRSITYRLHSGRQGNKMLRLPGAQKDSDRAIESCLEYAAAQGWTLGKDGDGRDTVGGEAIPRATSYSAVAFDGEAPELDRVLWAMACGTHHANWFALSDGLAGEVMRNDPFDALGGVVPLKIDGRSLSMFALMIFQGADAVVRARTELMGWVESDSMVSSRQDLNELGRAFVTAHDNEFRRTVEHQ